MKVSNASSLRCHLGLTNRMDGPERDRKLFTLTNTLKLVPCIIKYNGESG